MQYRFLQGSTAVAIQPDRDSEREDAPANPQLPTRAQVTAAKEACFAEREALRAQGFQIREDDVESGLRIANLIASAAYGVRGQYRKKVTHG